MSKTKEELDALKIDVEAVNEKLQELTPEEIAQVNGGLVSGNPDPPDEPDPETPVTATPAPFPYL